MVQVRHRAFGFTADDPTLDVSDLDGVQLGAVRAPATPAAEWKAQVEQRPRRLSRRPRVRSVDPRPR